MMMNAHNPSSAPPGGPASSSNTGLSGLNNAGSTNTPPPPPGTTRHVLPAESELRLEVPHGVVAPLTLRSHSGSAEIFGVELAPECTVHLSGTKAVVFTWHGFLLDVVKEDLLDIAYVSEETDANLAYVNTHAQLEPRSTWPGVRLSRQQHPLLQGPGRTQGRF